MFINSNIRVSHTFTIIGLIAESGLIGSPTLEVRVLPNLVLFLNTICNLQQLRMFFNDFFNLVQGMEGLGQETSFQLFE